MIEAFIAEASKQGASIIALLISGGILGLIQVALQMTIAINQRFDRAEATMGKVVSDLQNRQLATNQGIMMLVNELARDKPEATQKRLEAITDKILSEGKT